MNPVSISASCICLIPNALTSLEVILCAAPLSETSFPSIEPKQRTNTIKLIVFPIPFSIDTTALSIAIPSAMATANETITNAKKELIFRTRIRKRSRQIPDMTMIIGMVFSFGNWLLVAGFLLLVAWNALPRLLQILLTAILL